MFSLLCLLKNTITTLHDTYKNQILIILYGYLNFFLNSTTYRTGLGTILNCRLVHLKRYFLVHENAL